MISTRPTVLTTAAIIIVVVGISAAVAAAPVAEADVVNTTRSNIKGAAIGQQEADQSCINQAQGQGGQQAVPNIEQNTITDEGDPTPSIDVGIGKNPGGSGEGAGINSEGDPTVNAEQSNECSLVMEQTVVQNGDVEDSSTNEWTEE